MSCALAQHHILNSCTETQATLLKHALSLFCRQQTVFFIQQQYFTPPVMKRSLPFPGWVRAASLFLCLTQTALAMVLTNSTRLESILDRYRDKDEEWWRVRSRGKRAISEGDMHLILDLHNKLRGQVHPPASNMEYMVGAEDTAVCRRL